LLLTKIPSAYILHILQLFLSESKSYIVNFRIIVILDEQINVKFEPKYFLSQFVVISLLFLTHFKVYFVYGSTTQFQIR
jgi:hypothetical protein